MKNLFRWDNPLIQLLTALADVILTNLLCLICCLPVVTAGASIAATYKVMLNLSQDTGGGIWNTFFIAFLAKAAPVRVYTQGKERTI